MSKNPAKDFGQIASEYTFFEEHSTEAQEDVRAYQAHVGAIKPADTVLKMLDFGCGSGTFTMRFLKHAGWPPERLQLTLVEPAESVRSKAITRLAAFTASPPADSPALPDALGGQFDVVLANHVLYYVPDVEDTLRRLISALAPTGVFLLAVAGRTNLLIDFSIACFELLGREMPYNSSEDIEQALRALNAKYDKQRVPYELSFPDTEENRMRILRFLLADHVPPAPQPQLLAWFDQFSSQGRIEMRTATDHYAVRAPA
jgi:SAM-dependent methyltransferase